jgi:hypothetical protein
VIAIICVRDFWKFRQSPSDAARRGRLKAGGILLWASLLLFGTVIPDDVFGSDFSIFLMSLATAGGALLVYRGSIKR